MYVCENANMSLEPQVPTKKSSPPWQVLDLIAQHLDPKTLATACCVSKSWSISMSSDHLWHPICSTTYPSLSHLRPTTAVPYSRLYSLGRAADNRRRQKPPEPHLSLNNLIFAIDIQNTHKSLLSALKPCVELNLDKNGIFRFDFDVKGDNLVAIEALDRLRVTWNVVLEGFKSVFVMMDCEGKGNFVLGLEGWFSKELPAAGCCSGGGDSGFVAEMRLGLRESGGKVVVEKMSVGVLNIVSWRYVFVDDVIRYLQHFLLPCNYKCV